MTLTLIVLLVLVVGGVWFVVSTYNNLISLIKQVENAKNQIDVQLDKRFKVFEGLINTVRKVMEYEKTVLSDVVALRNQAQQAKKSGSEKDRVQAEEQISQIASQINVVFEQYPQLKAMNNAQQLQEEIVSVENQLSFAKQSYNDSLMFFETARDSFFSSIVVGMFSDKLKRTFTPWKLSVEKAQDYEEKVATL